MTKDLTQKMLTLTMPEMRALASLLREAQLQLAKGQLKSSREATISRVVGRELLRAADRLRKREERR